jgi:GH18 family chitinase
MLTLMIAQVWISIGGWSMNDPDQPTATTFSDLAGSTANQQKFFASLISFMSEYGFDGVDIDW